MPKKIQINDFLLNQVSFLILEDARTFREQLIKDIRQYNFKGNIFEAVDTKEAFEILSSKKIDFIICDWNLPGASGLDFLIEIRKLPNYKKTPFLMWTTKNEVANIISAIKAGADEYFCKPWTPEEAFTKISQTWEKVNK